MSENTFGANEWQQARVEARDAFKEIVIPWLKVLRDRINPSLELKAEEVAEDMLGDDTFQARFGNSRHPSIRGCWRFEATAKYCSCDQRHGSPLLRSNAQSRIGPNSPVRWHCRSRRLRNGSRTSLKLWRSTCMRA